MTFGSAPRRRWSTASSRRAGAARHANSDDDEDWLAGIRPDRDDEDWLAGIRPDRDDEPADRRPAALADPPAATRDLPSAAARYRPADRDTSGRHAEPGEREPSRFGREAEASLPPSSEQWSPAADERPVRGRRRAVEPDPPAGNSVPVSRQGRSARAAASASVPVRGAPLVDGPDRVVRPRGRASVTGRVSPPGSARVPSPAAGLPVDDSWTGSGRRAAGDSAPIRPRQRPDGPAGRTRGGYPPRAAQRPSTQPTAWSSRLLGLVSVLVLAAVAYGGYLLINDGRANSAATRSTAGPVVKARDISSRDVDQAPLSEKELFPGQQVAIGGATYQVLKTQATDCATAATDDLATLLAGLGCSQVVRGTLKSPDSQFLITAGIVNLKDAASANQAYETIKPTLDAQKGRFTGLAAGDGTDAIVRAPTTLGWHPRGHFLAYCVVARADGKAITADDPDSKQVISDVVEGYLRDSVLGARATTPISTPK
ncbi:hypothetical protein HC031_10655 [Planosporangium thailandense]|uniref:Uncharacterized protein n=1 Tax=Planosporangium thailandense TaxID=765197 RepID=A0ABX0XXS2_9ACTN|nr:hypothetical protein [Planosporangium thailandense]NJC70165.1 hypothetical protein [Planosporangium thailandense]